MKISNFKSPQQVVILKEADSNLATTSAQEVHVSDLERNLNHILEEHRHESGLHVIGGERRLLSRLVEFVEEELKQKEEPQKKTA